MLQIHEIELHSLSNHRFDHFEHWLLIRGLKMLFVRALVSRLSVGMGELPAQFQKHHCSPFLMRRHISYSADALRVHKNKDQYPIWDPWDR